MTPQLDLSDIETATLGHFLETGFMAPSLQGLLPGRRVFGPALTVRIQGDDGAMLTIAINLGDAAVTFPEEPGPPLFALGEGGAPAAGVVVPPAGRNQRLNQSIERR